MDNVDFCINDKPVSRRVVLGKSSEDDIVKLRVTLPASLGLGVDPETLTYAMHFALPDGTGFPTETLTLLGTTDHYVEYTVDDGVMLIEGYGTMALYGYDDANEIVWESQTMITQVITAVIASGDVPVKETGRISTSTHTVMSGLLAGDGTHVGVATAAQLGVDNAVSPEQFTGTDFTKVQAALDYALLNNVAVKFAKMYDITGNTLLINRADLYYATDRKQLYIIGVGGGIKKTDAGFIFDAPFANCGDVNVSGMKFESLAGVGTQIWNGDMIIRIKSMNNQYVNVDTILSAPNVYTQSTSFSNEHITGGNGWKFEAKRYLDVVIDKCLIEDCDSFIRNTEALSIAMCNSLRITNNLIENLTGTVAILGGSYGCDISNNYIEFCNEYIDLQTLSANYSHMGLNIQSNVFYQTAAQMATQTASIKLSNTNAATDYGAGGCFSSGNLCAGSVLYDISAMTTYQYIMGIGDYGAIIGTHYIPLGKPYETVLADGFVRRTFGLTTQYTKTFASILVPASSDYVLDIEPSFALTEFATVDVMQSSPNFIIKNVVVNEVANTIAITFTNLYAGAALYVTPRVVVTTFI